MKKETLAILILSFLVLRCSSTCLQKEFLTNMGFTPLVKLRTGEEWKFCSKMWTESGICVDEETVQATVENLQKRLLESQFKSFAGFNRIIPKMYKSTVDIRKKLQNINRQKSLEEINVTEFTKRMWQIVEKNSNSGSIIKELTYFQMVSFNSDLTSGIGLNFAFVDVAEDEKVDRTAIDGSYIPKIDRFSWHDERLAPIVTNLKKKTDALREKRFIIRGKIARNEAKINALVAKNEIVPGFPLKGAPDLTIKADVIPEAVIKPEDTPANRVTNNRYDLFYSDWLEWSFIYCIFI